MHVETEWLSNRYMKYMYMYMQIHVLFVIDFLNASNDVTDDVTIYNYIGTHDYYYYYYKI